MINREIKWSKNCVLTGKTTRNEIAEGDDPVLEPRVPPIESPTELEFNIKDCKLYVPIITLQEKYENKLLEGLKNGITFDF